jgi:hypothetical protein
MTRVLNLSEGLEIKVLEPMENEDVRSRMFRLGKLVVMRVSDWQVSMFNGWYDENIEDGSDCAKTRGEYWHLHLNNELGLTPPWK